MLEKFTRRDSGDFRQRYQGTYGYFRKGTSRQLVRLDRVDTEYNKITFVDADGINYELHADSDDDSIGFDFLPPKMSFHNTPSGTYLLRRILQRQYSRGLSNRNVSIRSVRGEDMEVCFQILKDIFEKPIPTKDAFNIALEIPPRRPERSFAISPQFAINLNTSRLYCFHDVIGSIVVGKLGPLDSQLAIKLTDPNLWGNEIMDALNQASIKGIIV